MEIFNILRQIYVLIAEILQVFVFVNYYYY